MTNTNTSLCARIRGAGTHGKLGPDAIATVTFFDEVKQCMWLLAGKRGHSAVEEFGERVLRRRRIEVDGGKTRLQRNGKTQHGPRSSMVFAMCPRPVTPS